MKINPLAMLLVGAMLLAAAPGAGADSYRCGRKLVRSGDSSADVLRVCGEPAHRDRGQETVPVDGASRRVAVERWYYRKSSRSLQHIVMIHQGRVVAIAVGGR
jgi:hypothetical protein